MAQQPPKTKSVKRASASATTQDEKARDKAAKKGITIDSFVNFAHNLGVGADNALSTATYGFNPVTRNRVLLEWVHRGSWLGGVAVDVVADDMTRAGVEIRGKMAPEQLAHLEETAVGLGIWNCINDTIKWARLYGGALAVILIDGQDMETPLRINTIRKEQFRGLLSLDRWMVEPSLSDLVTDFGPELGNPKFYRVTSSAPALTGMKIHHSRCIRLEGIRLPYQQRLIENMWGLSVIERLYDRMIAFDSASTGAAQLVYKSYLRTLKIDELREVVAAGGDAYVGMTRYLDMMRKFQGIEGLTIIDAKDEFGTETHAAFGCLSDVLAQFGQQLSGALQIPLVRLFGQSPAGFSTGDTDLRNYYDTIKQQQVKQLQVGVTKVYRIMAASESMPFPDGTKLEFKSLWQLDDSEKSTIAETVGRTVSAAEESGIIDRATALKELHQSSNITGIFTNITPEMIEEAENEGPPLGEVLSEKETVAEIKAGSEEEKAKSESSSSERARKLHDSLFTQAAGILFISKDDKMLLLERGPNGDEAGTWAIPAGRIENGENPKQAAIRETKEETGYQSQDDLQVLDNSNGFVTFIAFVDKPFKVVLNDESTNAVWTDEPALFNLHPGLQKVLNDHKV